MSKSYREASNDAKAVRAGIIEQWPVTVSKRRRRGGFVVESRWMLRGWREWSKWKAYQTLAIAEAAVELLNRKYGGLAEFRLREPAAAPDDQ